MLCSVLHKNFQNNFNFCSFCFVLLWFTTMNRVVAVSREIRAHRTCRSSLFSEFLRTVLIMMNKQWILSDRMARRMTKNPKTIAYCNITVRCKGRTAIFNSVRLTAVGKSRETSMAACAFAGAKDRSVHFCEREWTLRALLRFRRALLCARVHVPCTFTQMPGT